jgi:hypothetical protein
MIPNFDADGLLAPGDYEVSFEELRQSVLVAGDPGRPENWDAPWRAELVANLEILTRQLWSVGIREIYADGSFAEDKDHPNDIDGYFVLRPAAAGNRRPGAATEPTRSVQSVDLGPGVPQAIPRLSEEAAANVASVPR